MANEETIVNKIITVNTILEIANYLNDKYEEYKKLYNEEIQRNQGLSPSGQIFKYRLYSVSKIEYEITYTDNRRFRQSNYNWFIDNISNNPSSIRRAHIHYYISYSDNSIDTKSHINRNISAQVTFYKDKIYLKVDGDNLEEETNNLYNTLINMLENNEERYNKTVKNRTLRIQSFGLSIGFVLSYIIYFILLANMEKLPEIFVQFMNNKYFLIIGQWIVAELIGNVIGYPIIMNFYRNIIPKRKYSHYNKSTQKSVYIDNLKDFIEHNEVQIDEFADNGRKRILIEKIYKVTSKIVLVQVLLSIIFFLILK